MEGRMTDIVGPVPTPGPIPDDVGPRRLSVSQANMFEKCPRSWWWKYIIGLDDPAGDDARRGTLVHSLLEQLCLLPPAQRTIDTAARLAFEHWTDDDPAWLRRLAWRNVTRAIRLPEVVEPEVIATEVELDVTLDGVPFHGFIDRVVRGPKGIEIDDYKDGGKLPSERFRGPKRRQNILYAAAYEISPQPLGPAGATRPVAASLIYTALGVVDRYAVTGQSVTAAVRWLRKQWDGLRTARATGDFPIKPNGTCSWCPAVGMCPQGLDAVRSRAYDPTNSLGDHGRRALAAEDVEEETLADAEHAWELKAAGVPAA
jgi:putative RecB family exonuclease